MPFLIELAFTSLCLSACSAWSSITSVNIESHDCQTTRFIKILMFENYRPDFDSPSVFCRLLDKDKGGFFVIQPPDNITYTTKQQYLPSSNILQTRFLHEDGVVEVIDFFPRPKDSNVILKRTPKQTSYREGMAVQDELKRWCTRRVECVRGSMDLGIHNLISFTKSDQMLTAYLS